MEEKGLCARKQVLSRDAHASKLCQSKSVLGLKMMNLSENGS